MMAVAATAETARIHANAPPDSLSSPDELSAEGMVESIGGIGVITAVACGSCPGGGGGGGGSWVGGSWVGGSWLYSSGCTGSNYFPSFDVCLKRRSQLFL